MVKVVKTLMTLRGVTQAEVAAATGVTQATLSRYLNEASELRAEHLFKVLKYLGADIDGLVKREINKALGIDDEESLGEDIRVILQSMNPISRRTVVDAILASSKGQTPESKIAINRIKKFRDSINTVGRVSC